MSDQTIESSANEQLVESSSESVVDIAKVTLSETTPTTATTTATSSTTRADDALKAGHTCNKTDSSGNSVKRKLRSLTFGRRKKSLACASNKCDNNNCGKEGSNSCNNSKTKKNRSSVWAFKLCARTDSTVDVTETSAASCGSCVCTAYKKKCDEQHSESVKCNANSNSNNVNNESGDQMTANESSVALNGVLSALQDSNQLNGETISDANNTMENGIVTAVSNYHNTTFPTAMISEVRSVQVRVSELALALRSQLALTVSPYPYLARWGEVTELTPGFLNRFCVRDASVVSQNDGQQIHTQIDYIHCLVPDLLDITNCSFYWGKMDRYEAERLLENKPEGTFLLRDSAQEEHLFSVSFRRFDRSLHARIEQWNHKFSFDSHDPGVYASPTVCGLIEHYKDPSHCMFFEPMLTIPLHRNFPFSLQHMCRTTICSRVTYDSIQYLQLPKRMKNYLKEYHYKQQVRVRRLDGDH